MMRHFFAFLLCMFSVISLNAQSYFDSTLKWGDRPLTFDDFKGTPENDSLIFNMRWVFTPTFTNERHGRIRYTYAKIRPVIYLNDSWVRSDYKNNNTLLYCRTSFNLLEIMARRATRDMVFDKTNPLGIFGFYTRQFNQRFNAMTNVTTYGQDPDQMMLYASMVDDELEKEVFDVTRVKIENPVYYLNFSLGPSLVFVSSDYVSKVKGGLSFNFDIGYKRHLFGMDIQSSLGSKCKKDFPADMGRISEGEKVDVTRCMFDYGYLIKSNELKTIYPLVGLGVMNVVSAEPKSDPKMKSPHKNGFCMEMACLFNIPIFRHIDLAHTWAQRQIFQSAIGLRVKPFVSVGKVSDAPGWMPNAGVSVSFTIGVMSSSVIQ